MGTTRIAMGRDGDDDNGVGWGHHIWQWRRDGDSFTQR